MNWSQMNTKVFNILWHNCKTEMKTWNDELYVRTSSNKNSLAFACSNIMCYEPASYLIQADVSFLQLSEAGHLHNEDVSSFCAQQQQLP